MRGRIVALVIAVLLVFAAVLVAYLPASWVVARIPPELAVSCGEVNGSIWQGECIGASFKGVKLGDATWNLARLDAFKGRLVGDVDLRGAALVARADVDLSLAGSGQLRNLVTTLPLDPNFFPEMPADKRGTIDLDLKQATLVEGRPTALLGRVDVRDLRQVGGNPMDLGSYRAEFDGVVKADGTSDGKLRDLGGPFLIDAVVTLHPPNAYNVEGQIAGRTAAAERLVRNEMLAVPDASGRSPFGFEGTY